MTMIKRVFSLVLAMMMLLGCVSAVAEEFPKLDGIAAWDYVGDWFGVSGMDVMGDPTSEYPDLKLNLFLNGPKKRKMPEKLCKKTE
jgi:hypothetical protein